MNIERIELTNYGSWESLDLPIPAGVTLISGANGAGKSTILSAAEFCLFGATSDAGRLVRRGTDEAVVRVYLEDGLVVKRSIRRSGTTAKVSLSLRRFVDAEDHDDLTCATVSETQILLDGRLLGVTRETLRASALSMQGDGAAFCEARPADRKRVLMQALPSMDLWPALHEQAKAEAKSASDTATIARAELERLDGADGRLGEASSLVARVCGELLLAARAEATAEAEATRLAAEAEAAREARRQHAAAVEAEQRARADHERASSERAAADEALARAKAAAANAPSVEMAKAGVKAAETQLTEAERALAMATHNATVYREQRAEAEEKLNELIRENERYASQITDLMLRMREARTGTCPECKQALHDDSLLTRLKEQQDAVAEAQAPNSEEREVWWERLNYLTHHPEPEPDDTPVIAARAHLSAARSALAEAQAIQSLAGSIEAAEARAADSAMHLRKVAHQLAQADARVVETRAAIAENDDGEKAAIVAALNLDQARRAHSAAAAELARAEEAAKLAERQATEEAAARDALSVAHQSAAVADLLAKGFGPAGVPAMILDSILGALAETWNRVLADIGARQRIDLRSQKLLKTSDRLADTLDIIVLDGPHEAPFETLSGGEATRVSVAGRVALTELLASKKGARVSVMVLDEPAGLDAEGSEQLAAVLNEFVASGALRTILLITHADALADLIGNVVRVEKGADGCSRLAESAGLSALAPVVASGSSLDSGVAPGRAHTGAQA